VLVISLLGRVGARPKGGHRLECWCFDLRMVKKFLRSGTSLQKQRFVLRPICKSKVGEPLQESGSISYTCLWEQFKKKVSKLGYNPTDFGLHSLRAGGATKAANEGVLDRLFECHVKWRSENDKDDYIDDSVEHRLSVTRQLDL